MGTFINNKTGVVVNVDDSKDDRFTSGWTSGKKARRAATANRINIAPLSAMKPAAKPVNQK